MENSLCARGKRLQGVARTIRNDAKRCLSNTSRSMILDACIRCDGEGEVGDMEKQCRWCGAALQYHAGHGRPYRRNGWFHYECGTRWHPDSGWNRDLDGRCEANVYERALNYIKMKRTITVVEAQRVVREALKEGGVHAVQ